MTKKEKRVMSKKQKQEKAEKPEHPEKPVKPVKEAKSEKENKGKAKGLEKQAAGEIATKSKAAEHAQGKGKGVKAKQEAAAIEDIINIDPPVVVEDPVEPEVPVVFKERDAFWMWLIPVIIVAAGAAIAFLLGN
jgi:hypothetical protein